MRNLPFAIWMVGYAFVIEYAMHNYYLHGSSSMIIGMSATLMLVIWVVVGKLLYEKKL